MRQHICRVALLVRSARDCRVETRDETGPARPPIVGDAFFAQVLERLLARDGLEQGM